MGGEDTEGARRERKRELWIFMSYVKWNDKGKDREASIRWRVDTEVRWRTGEEALSARGGRRGRRLDCFS